MSLDMRFVVGMIEEVYRPTDEIHTARIKLYNGDIIDKVPFMMPLGSSEARYGHTMVDINTEVIVIKHNGTNWLIIGEVSIKILPQGSEEEGGSNGKSRNEIVLENIVKSIDLIADAFDDTMDIVTDIANTQKQVSYGLSAAATGLEKTSTSVAGSPSTPLSNSSAIAVSATTTAGYAASVLVEAGKTIVNATKFKEKYPPQLREYMENQKALYIPKME